MIDYGRVRSTVKPDAIVIDEFSVWKNTDIQEVTEGEFVGYEYNMIQYTKDEFILIQTEQNERINSILNTMLGG